MKNITRSEKRMFVAMALFSILLLGGALSWRAFTAIPDVQIPNPPLPNPNAYDTYLRAAKLKVPIPPAVMQQTRTLPDDVKPKERDLALRRYTAPQVIATVTQNQPALAMLRSGFAQEYREPPVRNLNRVGLQPHFTDFRELGRILGLESGVRAAQGNWSGAAQSALDILELGSDVPRGGPLISALVGYAIDAIGRQRLQAVLPHLDAAACRAAIQRLEELQKRSVPFAETMQEEKWVTQANLLSLMKQRGGIGMQMVGSKKRFRPISKRRLMREFGDYMDALSASARQPYAKAAPPTLPDNFFAAQLAPVLERGRWHTARRDAGNALLLTALALRLYHLEHGSYPEKLDDVKPNYLQTIPADPFGSGEALRYKKQNNDYVLWSIGSDKKDDGGQPIDNGKKQRRLVKDDSKGDFVFGVNR